MNGILSFAQKIGRKGTKRGTYLMISDTSFSIKIKNERDLAGRGKTAFVPRRLSVAAAKSRKNFSGTRFRLFVETVLLPIHTHGSFIQNVRSSWL